MKPRIPKNSGVIVWNPKSGNGTPVQPPEVPTRPGGDEERPGQERENVFPVDVHRSPRVRHAQASGLSMPARRISSRTSATRQRVADEKNTHEMLRPFKPIDVALVAAPVTNVQLAGTTMRTAAADVQGARLSALLDNLRLCGCCRRLPRCWSLPSRGLGFGLPRRLLLLRHVVSLSSSLLEMLADPSGMFVTFRRVSFD
jgi:hypothetical protein